MKRVFFAILAVLLLLPCSALAADVIKIGINAPMTGDIPKVGEGSKFAAQMWLADIEAAGGLEVGGTKYKVEIVIEDNESKAESAVKANTKMITEDEVLVIVGPQSSKQAVPAGGVAQQLQNPHDQPLVHQPQHHHGPALCLSRMFPRSFPGPGSGQLSSPTNSDSPKRPFCTMWPATIPRDWPSSSRAPGKRQQRRGFGGRVSKALPPKTPTSAPS